MTKKRPLILVDDDAEDQELIMLSLQQLQFEDEVKVFHDAEAALSYLYVTPEQPFIIVSDINMPKMDGITFKKKIDECRTLNAKCIPFVFLSTSTRFVNQTCDLNIQGYFEKGNSLTELTETVRVILSYSKRTRHTT